MSTRPSARPTRLHPLPKRDADAVGNLPISLTSLIGREREIATACALLGRDDVRLVTFTGPGGVGKTQLALAVARKLNDDFADGAVFVPLAPVNDPALVAPAIAQAFDVRDSGSRPLLDGLRSALSKRELLLVLDNFEHLLGAAPIVVDLLTACPHLKIMATSRALLHVSGEHAFPVPPLALPDPARTSSIEELMRSDAVDLFVTRAREVNPAFSLTGANADAVAEICRSLDGLPLAIELAAARVQVLSPQTLRAQMTDRLPLLTGGHRDAPERLQTMRHAIAWSYDLLSPNEQVLFRQLSVFVGGFGLEAAQAVTTDEFGLDDLVSLVDKSLVQQTEQPDGETRFSMLETIREYGLEQLAARGENDELQARHARYFLDLAEQADHLPPTAAKNSAGDQLEAERPNMRAALAWAEEAHDAELMLRLALALYWFWERRGSLEETTSWLERTIGVTEGVPETLRGLRAQLLAMTAYCVTYKGDEHRAKKLVDDAALLAQEAGDAKALAMAALTMGQIAIRQSEWDRAKTYALDALARWRDLDEPDWIVGSLFLLGLVCMHQGEPKEAETWFSECLAEAQMCGWPVYIAFGLEALGTCAREQGDFRRAAPLFAEALSLVQDGSDLSTVANCLKSLGAVAAVAGNAEQAARLFGAAEATRERAGIVDPVAEQLRLEKAYAPARAKLSADAFAAAWSAGRAMPLNQAIAEAFEVARGFSSERPFGEESPTKLTPRELAVLRLLVEGLSDKEIAEALGISRRTVSTHVATILAKLDVPSRTAAATYATRNNLI